MNHFVTREHEIEPLPGLPGVPPAGEVVLWQGRPSSALVARHLLKVRWICGYFIVLAGWAVASGLSDGRAVGGILFSVAILTALAAVLVGMIELFAWAVEKTTLYTVTTERVVMRFGVAISMTLNLPFRQIDAVSFARIGQSSGMIAIALVPGQRLSWLIQWPHVRGFRVAHTEPSLVYLPDAERGAAVLAAAIGQYRMAHAHQSRFVARGADLSHQPPAVVAAE
ncbi:photosynthetic complex putative assembly protein PuhB [Rhizobium sp. AAP43]|uniref:photosynthetic complex putative assembly protein PuhB n=1 Tax=Rhizobium sp. AAP43 TaxID=1523420 RepID=UPI0006B91FC2|nr:photosynthetic complex putative assembly protein PuhB [Rhizobium sp. AAP43]KPF43461.1 phosphonoacetate hydrolase [Rhizobium sp. AAP43]